MYAQPNGSNTQFQLQPYGTTSNGVTTYVNNVGVVGTNNSLTMTLATPAKLSQLELLYNGQGGGDYNVTLNFADGSSDSSFSNNPYLDWTNAPTAADPRAYADADLAQNSNTWGYWNGNQATGGINLIENDFNLPAADQQKLLTSVTFTPTSGGGLMIFALSGSEANGNALTNNLNVTADSTVDVRTSLTATMGNLTIGNNTLYLTGDSGASLTLGSGSLTGTNATFDVQGATILNLTGNVSGASRDHQEQPGHFLLSNAVNGYTGTTTINAGTVQFAASGSIGGSGRSVTVASGAVVAAGYPIDNNFLNRLAQNANSSVVALAANSGNNLDFSSSTGAGLPNASLGAVGSQTYSGTLTPGGSTYRLGGGGGSLTFASLLSGANSLSSTQPRAARSVLTNSNNSLTGSTTVGAGNTLQLAAGGVAPSPTITLSGGILSLANPVTQATPGLVSAYYVARAMESPRAAILTSGTSQPHSDTAHRRHEQDPRGPRHEHHRQGGLDGLLLHQRGLRPVRRAVQRRRRR